MTADIMVGLCLAGLLVLQVRYDRRLRAEIARRGEAMKLMRISARADAARLERTENVTLILAARACPEAHMSALARAWSQVAPKTVTEVWPVKAGKQ